MIFDRNKSVLSWCYTFVIHNSEDAFKRKGGTMDLKPLKKFNSKKKFKLSVFQKKILSTLLYNSTVNRFVHELFN